MGHAHGMDSGFASYIELQMHAAEKLQTSRPGKRASRAAGYLSRCGPALGPLAADAEQIQPCPCGQPERARLDLLGIGRYTAALDARFPGRDV